MALAPKDAAEGMLADGPKWASKVSPDARRPPEDDVGAQASQASQASPDWPARLLGLDIGSVRIGVALSDPTGVFAEPLAVLRRWPVRGRPTAAVSLATWAAEHQITQVVVGRPLRMSGEEGPAVATVETTVACLLADLDVDIIWWDERLSSREAERMMIGCGVRRDRRRETIDMVAASLILQSYLDARRSSIGVALPPGEGDASRREP